MNLIVLSLTYTFCKTTVSMRVLRMLLASFCGSIASALLLVSGISYGLCIAGQAFLVVPSMLFTAFGYCGRRIFLTRVGESWLSIVILNGVAAAVENLTGLRSLPFYALILAAFAARALVGLMQASVKRQSRMLAVTFRQGNARAQCLGLFDTGNLLSIPDTGEPVHIVSPAIIRRLGLDETGGLRLIPFQTLGNTDGWIRVTQVEELEVRMKDGRRVYRDVWCGVAEQMLLEGKSYQAILHSSL